MFKVFVAHPIPKLGLQMLTGLQVKVNDLTGPLAKADLINHAKDADAIIAFLSDKIDKEVFAACPNLRIISNYAVGFDNVDLRAAAEHSVVVTNTPDVLTEAVAEHAITLMLAAGRRIVEADRFMRAGRYKMWEADLLLGKQFKGSVMGVLGCGRIGTRVAEIANQGFGMAIIYYDARRNHDMEKHLGAKFVDQADLIRQADVLSIHVPMTESTRQMMDATTFGRMKPDAILINTSRGPVIDEVALVEALRNRTIAAAGLDVFENEPQMAPGLAELDNVVLTPHIASATITARGDMARLAAQAVLDVSAGKTPAHVIETQ
jgi:glyoxylate reductase